METKEYVPAIIMSRCSAAGQFEAMAHGNDNLYGSIQDFKLGDDLFPRTRFNREDNILWIDGSPFAISKPFSDFLLYIKDDNSPSKEKIINDMKSFFDLLVFELGQIYSGPANKLILVIHIGGDITGKHYERALEILGEIFRSLNISLVFRLATSASISSPTTTIDHQDVGLPGDAQLKSAAEIRNFLDTLAPATKEPGYEEIDKYIEDRLTQNVNTEIDLSGFHPSAITCLHTDEVLNSFFDTLSGEKKQWSTSGKHLLYTTYIKTTHNKDDTIGFKEITTKDTFFHYLVHYLCPTEMYSKCAFVYLGLDTLNSKNYNKQYEFPKSDDLLIPFFFVTLLDLMEMAEAHTNSKTSDADKLKCKAMCSTIEGRFRFFDSSIWFRFLPLLAKTEKREQIVTDINNNLRKKIFTIPQAIESRDFLIRTFNQSYVSKRPGPVNSSHGQKVTPWLFHSEFAMLERTQKLIEKNIFQNISWNLCIIDDHGKNWLDPSEFNKKQLIIDLIKTISGHSKTAMKGADINVTAFAETITDAKKALKELEKPFSNSLEKGNWPDIILLDYLIIDRAKNEFGDEIVKFIRDEVPLLPQKGPLQKMWFFPISVYANAIQSKLHEEGIAMYSAESIVATGADPISTPYLFLYNLFKMMERQVEEVIGQSSQLKKKSPINTGINEQLQQQPQKSLVRIGISEHLQLLCDKVDENVDNQIKKNAIEIFPRVVSHTEAYKNICRSTNLSVFSRSIYVNYFNEMRSYEMEQFRDVVYLLAYGGITDKDKLWGEWAITKDIIEKRIPESSLEKIRENINTIERYISQL